jgi:hypothetical protein
MIVFFVLYLQAYNVHYKSEMLTSLPACDRRFEVIFILVQKFYEPYVSETELIQIKCLYSLWQYYPQ